MKESTEVAELVEKARAAQAVFEQYSQQQVDEVVTALGWAIMREDNNRSLSEQAVADTGLGNVADKMIKNHRKTLGLLRDLKGAKSVGVIAEFPEMGLVEIAKPVGVVAAIVPSTNPAATPANKTINAIKCRNAIILAPSPKGQYTCDSLVRMMHEELDRVGAPRDLVQKLPSPVNKQHTLELLQQADLVVATGSQNNVRTAYTCGTPAVGVGAGNVVTIVDETAHLAAAAEKIVKSKTFDNATSCSSENSMVVVGSVFDGMLESLAQQKAVLLTHDEANQLQQALWQSGHLNPSLIAKDAEHIATELGFDSQRFSGVTVLMVEQNQFGADYPFSGEKLSPVLSVYRAQDFEDAKEIARGIMNFQGKGHSLGIHSTDDERILDLGLNMHACRVIVNQAHCFATGGSFDNGLPFSLSMGCGTWGNNSISDNMNYRHYMNVTRIARQIPAVEPSLDDVFGDYWRYYDIPHKR
ncbi:MAG: aldehyde dehydrogenase family protein [Pseudomonadota bacterium]